MHCHWQFVNLGALECRFTPYFHGNLLAAYLIEKLLFLARERFTHLCRRQLYYFLFLIISLLLLSSNPVQQSTLLL
jgi:hypothetical protein